VASAPGTNGSRSAWWAVEPAVSTPNSLVFEKRSQDLFHDVILGWGAGDLTLTTGGANKETIQIPNVLFVDRKMKAIERLIAVKPDEGSR